MSSDQAEGGPTNGVLNMLVKLVLFLRIGVPDRRSILYRREGQYSFQGEGEQTNLQSDICEPPIQLHCEVPSGPELSTGTCGLENPRQQLDGTAAPNRSQPPTRWTRTRGTRRSFRWQCSEEERTDHRYVLSYRMDRICGTYIWLL